MKPSQIITSMSAHRRKIDKSDSAGIGDVCTNFTVVNATSPLCSFILLVTRHGA